MKRKSGWAAGLVIATAGGVAIGTAAFGQDDPQPETAREHYAQGLSLEQVSAASRGKAGEIAPPCPEATVVAELKAQGLPVGPCDPVPEAGAPIRLAEEADEAPARDDGDVCPVRFIHTTAPGVPNVIEGPCGPGARIVDVRTSVGQGGKGCATVAYLVARGTPTRTDTVCVGDDRTDRVKPRALVEVD